MIIVIHTVEYFKAIKNVIQEYSKTRQDDAGFWVLEKKWLMHKDVTLMFPMHYTKYFNKKDKTMDFISNAPHHIHTHQPSWTAMYLPIKN